jgi:quercetin dioxygenase-like cupin family protein
VTISTHALMMGAAAMAAGLIATSAVAMDEHTVTAPDQVQWGPASPALPPGAEAAVLFGNPGEDGLFALRLKFPAGYHVPPHTHPKPEVVTVISGSLKLGTGEMADEGKAQVLEPGALFAIPPGMAHYVYAEEETVVQLNSVGPFGVTYVDPKDDPRKTQ